MSRINTIDTIALSDTFFLDDAISLYRQFWDRCWHGHKDKQVCRFDGSINDLYMLDYCEYELGHPDENYEAASIIWANVILTNTDLFWGEKNAEVYLFTNDINRLSFEINVYRYAKNIIYSGISRDDYFSSMTEKLIIDMLSSGYDIENLQQLKSIVYQHHSGDYSHRLIWAVGKLYKDHKEKLASLHHVLDGKS